jgi:hypothetical protein
MPDHTKFQPSKESNPDHSPLRRFTPTPHPDNFVDDYSHVKPGIWPFPDKLHVMTVLSNPPRFRSRYELYRAYSKRVEDSSAILHTCEIAFGGRHFEITDPSNPHHLQLRTSHELWHKENALNILIQHARRLYPDMKYVAWIDADIQFARPDWAQETLHQLQHFAWVQMFSHAQDLGPAAEPYGGIRPSFLYSYLNERPNPHDMPEGWDWATIGHTVSDGVGPVDCYYPEAPSRGQISPWFTHPGFAWAARVEALDKVAGLIDWAILGSGDYHMACALVGHVEYSLAKEMPGRYQELCYQWQALAEKHIRRNVGCVSGIVNHGWHGKRAARLYDKRWKFLKVSGFNPDLDLKRDTQGLWQLEDRGDQSIVLRDGLRAYARLRNEDGNDV